MVIYQQLKTPDQWSWVCPAVLSA